MRRWLIGCGLVIVTLVTVWFLFGPLTSWIAGTEVTRMDTKDRFAATSTIRTQIGSLFGGLAVAGGLFYTARRYFLDRDRQFTERFTAAVEHLGSENVTVRAGGVAALDRILRDSPADRNRVLDRIAGFLRQQTIRVSEPLPDDVMVAVAALRVPRKRIRGTAEEPLNLTAVRLPGADMRRTAMPTALLAKAELREADLSGANLAGAKLDGSTLINANLAGADLTAASLAGARLSGANLTDAVLADADLSEADLTKTIGLTTEQIASARVDDKTRIPAGLTEARAT
ncbi:pentapeptide repeat protein [Herbihabitans rhizosphaerae]|uniref:Pentapeptide repeat protein n=1 Tax=Herbihabitans rhizosphaerae TaxID=1872711 RepID=A0A4V2ERG1_9PSEU|nr:pentapeptide repeat-containing protein [Herbihabitans rhizosphaerae]RZS31193.1 pentapeptide repeat protein [Herbihabitans rhizosphaerae]